MKYISSLLILVILVLSCQSSGDQKKSKQPSDQAQRSEAIYPTLPVELHKRLYDQVDYLDYIFHDLPFSMSQSEKPSVQTNIAYIGQGKVMGIPQGCKPVARQFYQIQGEIIFEADVYFSEGCQFYIFYENGQAKYANAMSENGIAFFNKIISQAIEASNQVRNQASGN
jgi:hypothetical protein